MNDAGVAAASGLSPAHYPDWVAQFPKKIFGLFEKFFDLFVGGRVFEEALADFALYGDQVLFLLKIFKELPWTSQTE